MRLRTYWSIPDRQIETSVVLADERWWALQGAAGDINRPRAVGRHEEP